jgi:radical SAM superfamily enzyme YgiQ (UPF0313 family)
MNYEGKVYRPWMEADSFLIQTTIGCTHNKCTFCDMFREKRFRIRDIEDIFNDIVESRKYIRSVRSIFLIDGNVLALKTDFLLKILHKVTATFPECKKISVYAGLNDLRRKSIQELKELKDAGLTMVYKGIESGDAQTLESIKKGLTPEQAIQGMAHAKAAGIQVLISIIFGIGGKERSKVHIIETTKLLNILQPEELAPMVLTIQPGTILKQQVDSGGFVQATPLQILEEEKYLLENIEDFPMLYWGDHGNNIETLKGMLPAKKEFFLHKIDDAIAHHPITQQDVLLSSPW